MTRVLTAFGVSLALLGATQPLVGQTPQPTDPMLGIGYVGQGPDMFLGGTVWGLVPGLNGWGLYLDAKFGTQDRADEEGYEPGIDAAEAPTDDIPIGTDEYWRSFNAAVVRVLTDELTVYLGGGWAEGTYYQEYFDGAEVLGRLGYYWTKDGARSGGGVNVLAGGFLRVSPSVRIQFGAETRPAGYTVGLSFVIPGR